MNDRFWRAPWKGAAFPVGASPTRQLLQSVQKLQTALHAKAKTEADYRFYALYEKIHREGMLTHAYAQCRSNKGAPGVDDQDFADVEAYGVQRWLGELALALRQLTSNTVLSRVAVGETSDPAGYTQPSIVTVRLWKHRYRNHSKNRYRPEPERWCYEFKKA